MLRYLFYLQLFLASVLLEVIFDKSLASLDHIVLRPGIPLTADPVPSGVLWIIACKIIICGMKLLIHSLTSTVQPLKFRNG